MFSTRFPYSSKYFTVQYNENIIRFVHHKYYREKGWEIFSNLDKKNTDKIEIERVSLSRTKAEIRELALVNNFEYFGTLTLNGYFNDRYDLNDCQSNLRKVLKSIKRNNKEFKYLIITEKHKDNAFHFHGLFSGIDLYLNNNGYFSNVSFDNLGFNSFSLIKDNIKCANYITKYITKDCVKNSRNQIFIRSKGLTYAAKEEIKIRDNNLKWNFENDFVKIHEIDLTNLSDNDKMFILNTYIE